MTSWFRRMLKPKQWNIQSPKCRSHGRQVNPLAKFPASLPYMGVQDASCVPLGRHRSRRHVQHQRAQLSKQRRKLTVWDLQCCSPAPGQKSNSTREKQNLRLLPNTQAPSDRWQRNEQKAQAQSDICYPIQHKIAIVEVHGNAEIQSDASRDYWKSCRSSLPCYRPASRSCDQRRAYDRTLPEKESIPLELSTTEAKTVHKR